MRACRGIITGVVVRLADKRSHVRGERVMTKVDGQYTHNRWTEDQVGRNLDQPYRQKEVVTPIPTSEDGI